MSIDTRKPGSSMDNKQKIIIGVMAIVVIIVIWQVVGLFGGGGSSPPAEVTKSTTRTTTTQKSSPSMNSPAASAADTTASSFPANPQNQMNKPQEAPVQNNSEILKIQKDSEEKYLTNVNQLQMLKLQQQIAETNQAIASAKLATVTSEKSIADMLTKPAPTPVSISEYASNMAGIPSGPPVAAAVTTTTTIITKPDTPYAVLSVAQQGYKWSAIVGGLGGKLYKVGVGDSLNDDGSKVISINRVGIVLEKDGKKRKISLSNPI